MNLTALDIQQQQFRTRLRGFDIREVDGFLEQAAAAFERLQAENQQLRLAVERLEKEKLGYRRREDTFRRAMINSQAVIEQMKQNAEKSADLIVAEAEVKADRILGSAHGRLARLHEDITELKRQRVRLETQIRSTLEAHAKLLDLEAHEAEARDQEDDKVQLLKKS
jgi:cell division initiation protein